MATKDNNQNTQSIQSKVGFTMGMNKSSDRLSLKDGEYTHLKNALPSSELGDEPFVQNAGSNEFCCSLPEGYFVIGKPVYVKERELNILCLVNPLTQESEIGYFYVNECRYEAVINDTCLNFRLSNPIKGTYKIINCELSFYFQDGFNPDRRINLDKLPWKQAVDINGCVTVIKPLELECGQINIQNELEPPVVKPTSVEETGALFSGAYQFAVCYANINGDALSSYYSKTNIVPIYADSVNLGWKRVEGSAPNVLTTKSIVVGFENLDTRYEYINLAVIKTLQGSPSYEKVVTLPIGTTSYIYTGRETTTILSLDELIGLNPDYVNSKTLTAANNHLIRANLSTQDEGNYQRLANLIELGWAATKIKADDVSQSYKAPLTTTNKLGYQRGETYPIGIRFLFNNGTKSSVYHIPGRLAKPSDLILVTDPSCNHYELSPSGNSCFEEQVSAMPYWQLYDTATVDYLSDDNEDCFEGVFASGEFAYWESTQKYPCNEDVWGELAGQPIRHHRFPSNETFHIQNQPYNTSVGALSAYNNDNVFLYPIGVTLKKELQYYIDLALSQGVLSQKDAAIIAGYEIVRGDRRQQKSVIAKGLLFNMFSYFENSPEGNTLMVSFPNYPFNDLSSDPYLNNSDITDLRFSVTVEPPSGVTYTQGDLVEPNSLDPLYQDWNNPFVSTSVDFVVPETFSPTLPFDIEYTSTVQFAIPLTFPTTFERVYVMLIKVYDEDGEIVAEYEDEVRVPLGNVSNLNTYSKRLFTFHSPDTHFRKPFLGTYLRNHVFAFGAAKQIFEPVEGHPLIKPFGVRDGMNHAVSAKSEGNYNNWIPVDDSNARRQLVETGYLAGNSMSSLESGNILNNLTRESSVVLRLNCDIEDAPSAIQDTSKQTIRTAGKCGCKEIIDKAMRNRRSSYALDPLCTRHYNKISSYYSSLNIKIPNQYGDIFSISYLSTGTTWNPLTSFQTSNKDIVFGGDTFITRFSVLRKHGFFGVDFINQSAFGVDYTDNFLGAKPNFYLRNTGGVGKFVIDRAYSNLDCSVENRNRNGWVYLYNRGVAHFFVESDVNTELRYSGTNIWEKWYPSLKTTTFSRWTEQLYNPIEEDNSYLYNWNYSKPNREEALFTPARDFVPNSSCKNSHPRRIIYSKQSNEEESSDAWQVYPANQYYDVETHLGAITDVQAIDAFKVLVRCENGTLMFNAYDTLELESTLVTVGTGGMFAQRPQTFGNTDTGYAGSNAKFAMDITSSGVFFTDAERGQVLQYSGKLLPISKIKMNSWFIENLKLKFLEQIKDLPNFNKLNKDNPFYGFGLTSVYDNENDLWFLTKKDYVVKESEFISNIEITEEGELLYNDLPLNFGDTEVFEDVSFTISFRPAGEQSHWFSFHSFCPNYYSYGETKFYSGLNDYQPSLWRHWSSNSFQTYYGVLYPFEVNLTTANMASVDVLHSIEYELKSYKVTDAQRKEVYSDPYFNFNKALVSTQNQSSGKLNLILKDKNNPFQSLLYPQTNNSNPLDPSIDTLFSKVEGNRFRLNQFFDIVLDKTNGLPIFRNSLNGVDQEPINLNYNKVNNEALKTQKFRNSWFDVLLKQDKSSEHKMVLNLLLNKTNKSFK